MKGIVTLIEFVSKEAAEKFYFSNEYKAAKAIRDKGVDTDLIIIEGMYKFSISKPMISPLCAPLQKHRCLLKIGGRGSIWPTI